MKRKPTHFAWAFLATLAGVAACGDDTRQPEMATAATSALVSPAAPGSSQPHLAHADNGSVVLSWLEPDGDDMALRYAVLRKDQWEKPRTVAFGRNWFVNWADFPSVVPVRDDFWAAHWLVKRSGGTYAYDVSIALSNDAGTSWSEPIVPHDDGTPTEHGFVSLFPTRRGVGAVWLDGRNMAGGAEPAMHHEYRGSTGGMTLRFAELNPDGEIIDSALIDELVCDCCQTDAAISGVDPVIVYRNRTPEEVRDVYVALSGNGDWPAGAAIHDDGWEIAGCPVNGPAVAADGDDIAVAWFTAAEDNPRVRAAYSADRGMTFGAPVDIDTAAPVGRVDVEMLGSGTFIVSWLARKSQSGGRITARAVGFDGELHPRYGVAQTATGRSAGVPQMVRQGDYLVFAWTEASGATTTVATARTEARNFTAGPDRAR